MLRLQRFAVSVEIWAVFTLGLILLFVSPQSLEARPGPGEANVKYESYVREAARRYDIDAKLIHSIITAESNYNPSAVSRRGAMGLMQLMPDTAEKYGVRNVFNPKENIEAGVRYLRDLGRLLNQNLSHVLAAYNAGPEAVKKYGGIPPFPETRNYIRKVTSLYNRQEMSSRTQIYRYLDEQGRLILTNDRNLYLLHKSRRASDEGGQE